MVRKQRGSRTPSGLTYVRSIGPATSSLELGLEVMSGRARRYQTRITGHDGKVCLYNGVKFDGADNGVLLDAKGPGYATFVKDGEFMSWLRGREALVDEAKRQIRAAKGVPIEWHVAERETAIAMRKLLDDEGCSGITVLWVPDYEVLYG